MWHWLTTDPIGQFVLGIFGNLLASAICFLAGGRWIWKRHLRPHFQHVRELHAQLVANRD